MNAATLEREKQDVDNPALMTHISTDRTCRRAVCGAKLRGLDLGPPSSHVDCHVCAEMWAAER